MTNQKLGRAYAFFDCRASKEQIEGLLPKARHYAEAPSELELNLIEDSERTATDEETKQALEAAKKYSLRKLPKKVRALASPVSYQYALQARLPNATNVSTANKMNNLMNLLYGKELYPEQEDFFGEIVYQRGNQWVHAV